MTKFTSYAEAHVDVVRRQQKSPTWDDVAYAYDMGLTHAVTRNGVQRRYLRSILSAVRALNTPEPVEEQF